MSTSSIALLSVQFGEEMESRRSINLTNNSAECACSVIISEVLCFIEVFCDWNAVLFLNSQDLDIASVIH